MNGTVTAEHVRELLEAVVDPEIPVLTIEDLGVLRDVRIGDAGEVEVAITPTYSGCPAMEVIEADIVATLAEAGLSTTVVTVLDPAWTTDDLSEVGKMKLRDYGIAPPGSATIRVVEEVRCPRCDDGATRVVSEFGSTACKRLMVCTSCGEPFDQFKAI